MKLNSQMQNKAESREQLLPDHVNFLCIPLGKAIIHYTKQFKVVNWKYLKNNLKPKECTTFGMLLLQNYIPPHNWIVSASM